MGWNEMERILVTSQEASCNARRLEAQELIKNMKDVAHGKPGGNRVRGCPGIQRFYCGTRWFFHSGGPGFFNLPVRQPESRHVAFRRILSQLHMGYVGVVLPQERRRALLNQWCFIPLLADRFLQPAYFEGPTSL